MDACISVTIAAASGKPIDATNDAQNATAQHPRPVHCVTAVSLQVSFEWRLMPGAWLHAHPRVVALTWQDLLFTGGTVGSGPAAADS